MFTTDDELGVPFERPAQFGDRQFVTAEEFVQRQSQSERQDEADRESFVAPRPQQAGGPVAGGTGPPAHWIERGRPSRRTSLVIDPPDGRIPFLNDEARRRGAVAAMRTPEGIDFAGPEDLDKYDRCITRGFPHVIFPTIYDNTSQIVQGPGYVGDPLRDDSRRPRHPARRLPGVRTSRRRSARTSATRAATGTATRSSSTSPTSRRTPAIAARRRTCTSSSASRGRRRTTVHYELTVDDPTTFSRPWTASLDLKKDPRQVQVPEYACHEGNYAMFNILSGARADEKRK